MSNIIGNGIFLGNKKSQTDENIKTYGTGLIINADSTSGQSIRLNISNNASKNISISEAIEEGYNAFKSFILFASGTIKLFIDVLPKYGKNFVFKILDSITNEEIEQSRYTNSSTSFSYYFEIDKKNCYHELKIKLTYSDSPDYDGYTFNIDDLYSRITSTTGGQVLE